MMRICGSGSQTPINFKTFGSHHPDFEKKAWQLLLQSDIMTAFLHIHFEWAFSKLELTL